MRFASFPNHSDVFDVASLEGAIERDPWLCFSAATVANQTPLLKRIWGNKVAEPMYDECKLYAMAKKDTNFGGEGRYVTVNVTPIAGVSASMPDAVASQAASITVRFFVSHRKEYAVWSLQNDIIERTKGNANAVLEIVKKELDMARRAFARRMANRMYGSAGGCAAQLSTATNLATTTATVTNRTDMMYLDKNMQLEFSSANGTLSTATRNADLRGGVNPVFLTINSVNRDAGTFVTNAVLNTVPGITNSDFIANRGDYANAMTGAQGWNPYTAPTTGDNFMGYDRSGDDVQRVSGVRVSGAGKTMLETLEDAGGEAKLNGLSGERVLCINPLDMVRFRKEISAMGQINMADVSGGDKGFKYSFKAVKVDSQIGELTILVETGVTKGFAWLLDASEIYIRSTSEIPKDISGQNGLLTDYTDDARQGRIGAYGNIFFENPGVHVIISWLT